MLSDEKAPAAEGTNKGTKSAVDAVLEEIRTIIEDDGLVVGDPLPPEAELARRTGTGRNTVREAISILKAYGVVEPRQRVGPVLVDKRHLATSQLFAFSQRVSPEAFQDIQGFRRLIEEGIVDRLLAGRSEDDLTTLADYNARMAAAENVADAAYYDYRFHLHLVTIAGNTTTVDVYRFLEPVIRRLLENGKEREDQRRDIAGEHDAIIQAVREQKRLAYLYWMTEHLRSGLQFIPKSDAARSADP